MQLEISNLKKDLKSRNSLLKELAAVEAEDDEEEEKPQGRQNKTKGKSDDAPLTRNLFANIK